MGNDKLDHDVFVLLCDCDAPASEAYFLVKVPGKSCTVTHGDSLNVDVDYNARVEHLSVCGQYGGKGKYWFDNEEAAIQRVTQLRNKHLAELKNEISALEKCLQKPVNIAVVS